MYTVGMFDTISTVVFVIVVALVLWALVAQALKPRAALPTASPVPLQPGWNYESASMGECSGTAVAERITAQTAQGWEFVQVTSTNATTYSDGNTIIYFRRWIEG